MPVLDANHYESNQVVTLLKLFDNHDQTISKLRTLTLWWFWQSHCAGNTGELDKVYMYSDFKVQSVRIRRIFKKINYL